MSQVEDAIAVREATDWNARENEHLKTIDKELKWYRGHAKWNRIAHRIASIVVLFCSIVAPITVAGDDKTSILIFGYHIDKAQLSSIALIVTLILALTEGLRRLFHFEQQWATSNRVERALQDARSDFLDQVYFIRLAPKNGLKNIPSQERVSQLLSIPIRKSSLKQS
jgi:fumarate reductase subunit D